MENEDLNKFHLLTESLEPEELSEIAKALKQLKQAPENNDQDGENKDEES